MYRKQGAVPSKVFEGLEHSAKRSGWRQQADPANRIVKRSTGSEELCMGERCAVMENAMRLTWATWLAAFAEFSSSELSDPDVEDIVYDARQENLRSRWPANYSKIVYEGSCKQSGRR
jgi:hypothetical protein